MFSQRFLFFLLFILGSATSRSQAQVPVYQAAEVDSVAQPRGGVTFLEKFLDANLRKPFPAQIANVSGRVVLQLTVEPDGRATNVQVLRSLRPDCDTEALRVMRLFAAWQPARKAGVAVRQVVFQPVLFRANEPLRYVAGKLEQFLDARQQFVADADAQFKFVSPTDSLTGLPTGDRQLFERGSKRWRLFATLPFVREPAGYRGPSGRPVWRLGIQRLDKQWQGSVYELDDLGAWVRVRTYGAQPRYNTQLTYHANGAVAQYEDRTGLDARLMTWYPNGQLQQIWAVTVQKPLSVADPDEITALWDETGRQQVKDSHGSAVYHTPVRSLRDTTQQTTLTEQGDYVAGRKHGPWSGRYADGSFQYDEHFNNGVCEGGQSVTNGQAPVRYVARLERPSFSNFGDFISQNFRYPYGRDRVKGARRAKVSFTVNPDGSVCNLKIVQSADGSFDNEVMRLIQVSNGRWKPGTIQGRPAAIPVEQAVNFTF